MLDIVYISDADKFLIKATGKRLSRDNAAKYLLSKHEQAFPNHSVAHAFLDDIQASNALSSFDLKQEKSAEQAIDWDALYADVADRLPVVFAITDTAQKLLFNVTPQREVRKVSFKTADDAVNALLKDTPTWEALKSFYHTTEHLLPMHRRAMQLVPFVKQLAMNFLLVDTAKKIEPDDIKRISWDEADYAYKKFDASRVQPGPTPAWDEFTSRLDYPDVFRAWVWGVVEPSNNIRQALWIVGEGNDGKSAAQNALTALLGRSYVKAMQDGELNEKFFLSGVYGKTLITYADARELYIFNNPKIKQITGADSTSIEFKGQDSFTGNVYCKLFVTSNKNPKINPESRAQLTRLIRLEVSKPKTQDAGFQARLEAEIWPFLHQCREAYERLIDEGNNKLNIPLELQDKIIELCSSDGYSTMRDFVSNHVEFDVDAITPVSEFRRVAREFAISQHIETSQIKHLLADAEEKFFTRGVQTASRTVNNRPTTVYKGIRIIGDIS